MNYFSSSLLYVIEKSILNIFFSFRSSAQNPGLYLREHQIQTAKSERLKCQGISSSKSKGNEKEKRKTSGTFACNQTRETPPEQESYNYKRREARKGRRAYPGPCSCVLYLQVLENRFPRKKTPPKNLSSRQREQGRKEESNLAKVRQIEFFYKEGFLGFSIHPLLLFSIFECVQHRLVFGNECWHVLLLLFGILRTTVFLALGFMIFSIFRPCFY